MTMKQYNRELAHGFRLYSDKDEHEVRQPKDEQWYSISLPDQKGISDKYNFWVFQRMQEGDKVHVFLFNPLDGADIGVIDYWTARYSYSHPLTISQLVSQSHKADARYATSASIGVVGCKECGGNSYYKIDKAKSIEQCDWCESPKVELSDEQCHPLRPE